MQPVAIAERMNHSAHDQFWLGVLALDAPHALAALCRCECVHGGDRTASQWCARSVSAHDHF